MDNTTALAYSGKQESLFGLSSENAERIKRQNSKKISVIIGNPPYNAKQQNYNYQNSNRAYLAVNRRIKDTYVKYGTAQNQNQVYDMYFKFFRWASDRLDSNGILSFVINRSFIDAKAFDGVRKCFEQEFDNIYIYDLGGDIVNKVDKDLPTGNVFNIKTGVALAFLVKSNQTAKSKAKITYYALSDQLKREEKIQKLKDIKFQEIEFNNIISDNNSVWINHADSDFKSLLPLINNDTKSGKSENALFKLFSRGIATQRDEWVYDESKQNLQSKIKFIIDVYSETLKNNKFSAKNLIKWDRELDKYVNKKIEIKYDDDKIIRSLYRPFSSQFFYFGKHLNGMTYRWFDMFKNDKENRYISFISGISKQFSLLSSNNIMDLNFLSPAAGGTQCLPLYRYDKSGNRQDNITDWALNLFRNHYQPKPFTEPEVSALSDAANAVFTGLKSITKEDIFHYTYAVLHNPAYRKKYELDLKREFPRLPLYADFFAWADLGKQLLDLHIGYETAKPFDLKLIDSVAAPSPLERAGVRPQKALFPILEEPEPLFTKRPKLKVKLKADKESGTIELDEQTALTGVPKQAWDYKLGNRSALEWVLDQYKEKKPSDPTIAEKFNTYRFADYKEHVIMLLKRVCTVSVETMRLVGELEKLGE